MDTSLRVAVVTGASAGVGRAVARELGRRGVSVGLVARNREALEAAASEVAAAGGRAIACEADVADARQVADAARRVEERFGPIDVWINNAMVTVVSPVAELTAEEARRVTEVTYLGTVHGTLEALQRMRPRGRGTIVPVGSALAYRSIPLQAAYCGAKAAVRGFTDSLRSELIHDRSGVHLTIVHLPAVNTPQFDWCRTRMPCEPQPVPPVFQPEVAARAIVWAASQRRREVVVGASTLAAIVLNKFVPGLLDRYAARTAYAGQQRDTPVAWNRRDNLLTTLPGDRGAHGAFDTIAHQGALTWWLNRHRMAMLSMLAFGIGAALAARASR